MDSITRLYIPRKLGGRGLILLEEAYVLEIIKLAKYVESKVDPLVRIVRTHQHETNSYILRMLETERYNYKKEQDR